MPEPTYKNIFQSTNDEFRLGKEHIIESNPILQYSSLYILRNGSVPERNIEVLDTNTKCANKCIDAVDEQYKAINSDGQEIIASMLLALNGHSTIEITTFPTRNRAGHIQEFYDFGKKSLSICPLSFKDYKNNLFIPTAKQELTSFLAHEMAHALDRKASIKEGEEYNSPSKIKSHDIIVKSLQKIPENKRNIYLTSV